MTPHLRLVTGLLAAMLMLTSQSSRSEETIKVGPLTNVTAIDGPFEASIGGVPLLGYVVDRPKPGNVKFMLCDNKFVDDVDEKLLSRSKARCPPPPKGRQPGVNPFVRLDDVLVPWTAFTAGDKQQAVKKFGVEINTLPFPFRELLTQLPAGEQAAIGYQGPDGRPQLGVITTKIGKPQL